MLDVSSILKTVEKLLGLLRGYSENDRIFYKEIISPLLIDTESVVQNYHLMWETLRNRVSELNANYELHNWKAREDLAKEMQSLREQQIIARRRLVASATQLKKRSDVTIRSIGQELILLFHDQEKLEGSDNPANDFLVYFTGKLESELKRGPERIIIKTYEQQDELRRRWKKISSLAAELQLRSVRR